MQSPKSAEAGPGQARVGRARIMTALVWFLIVYTGPVGWGGNFGPAKLGPYPTQQFARKHAGPSPPRSAIRRRAGRSRETHKELRDELRDADPSDRALVRPVSPARRLRRE